MLEIVIGDSISGHGLSPLATDYIFDGHLKLVEKFVDLTPGNDERWGDDNCLSACSLVEITPKSHPEHTFILCAEPTPIQNKAFQLLKLNPRELVPMKLTA